MSDLQKQIDDGLAKFRKERGIESDCGDLVDNLSKELQEALEAVSNEHKAEEFADIYILAANAIGQMRFHRSGNVKSIATIAKCANSAADLICKEILEFEVGQVNAYGLNCITLDAKKAIEFLGYHPEKLILEKVKLINTRKGKMNSDGSKWEKDKNQNPDTLYKPDYDSCQI